MSILLIALKNWKIIVGFAAGFALAWWIQGVRVDRLNIANDKLTNEIQDCQKANNTNQATITNLKKEITDTSTLCSSRLKVKDSVIDRLKYIDNLKVKSEGTNEKDNIADAHGDAILRELNGMFTKTGR
ncbi:MAG: hypothetical protein AAB948_04035 [Patescibacteria group bacterium]